MTDEQQEIDDYITRIIEKWEELDKSEKEELDTSMDDETKKAKLKEPMLDFASLLQSKGHRPESICDEIIHLLKGVTANEVGNPPMSLQLVIRLILRDTRFQPSVNLKVYDLYGDMGSKTAYIHEDVIAKLGLFDADEDNNIIEIETKSGKRTVANVLKLRDVDKRRDNIIRLGTMLMINLGLERDYETVTVRKAMKPVPAYNVALFSYPGQAPVGEYYLKKKFQGIPICVGDWFVGTTLPYSDSRWIIFAIKSVGSKVEYERNFGSVYMITSETSFEEIISEGEEEKD